MNPICVRTYFMPPPTQTTPIKNKNKKKSRHASDYKLGCVLENLIHIGDSRGGKNSQNNRLRRSNSDHFYFNASL